jgi:hypothetical protein
MVWLHGYVVVRQVLCSGCPEANVPQVLDDLVGKTGLSVVSGCTMLGLGTCAVDRCEVSCAGCPEDNILQVLDDMVGKRA